MIVRVTQEHIAKGVPRQPDQCPLAYAFLEAGMLNASVGCVRASWNVGGGRRKGGLLPSAALAFREQFDSLQPVQPIEFEMKEAG